MPFYMNVFDQEFRGDLVLADRKHIPTFVVPANKNRNDQIMSGTVGPYDLSALPNLKFNYAIDPGFRAFASFSINIAGATPAATTAQEIVDILNANTNFSGVFTATVKMSQPRHRDGFVQSRVFIASKRPGQAIRSYVSNAGAEQVLKFNQMAGIGEMPSFFDRHLISNWQNPESEAMLIRLDGTDVNVDRPIIRNYLNNQAWTNADLRPDYMLLGGRSGLFTFKKQTVDGSGRVTALIEYPAGASVGDFAKKTTYSYTSSNTAPDVVAEVPYVLTTGDMITPP